MAKQVPWCKPITEEFIHLAELNPEEIDILKTRVAGLTITQQSMKFHMSESKVSKIVSRLKKKYDIVQPYSAILPPRKFSVQETYMDTH